MTRAMGLACLLGLWTIAVPLNRFARTGEGEPPGEPISQPAQTEPRPPGITQDALGAKPAAKPELKPTEVKVPTRKEPVSYAKEIADILEDKCVGCHGGALA